jgi:hypothetical protein
MRKARAKARAFLFSGDSQGPQGASHPEMTTRVPEFLFLWMSPAVGQKRLSGLD